jgi:site-specific recombinase XerD
VGLADISLEMITKESVIDYLQWLENDLGNSISTRNQRLACIRSFVSQIPGKDLALKVQLNEISSISIKKCVNKNLSPNKYFEDDVLTAILSQPDSKVPKEFRNLFFLALLYDTGGRVQEILDLKPMDFHLEATQPYVALTGKGNKIRFVPLMPNTIKLFTDYMKIFHSTYPFAPTLFYINHRSTVEPMSRDCVAKFIEKYRISAKKTCPKVPEKITAHMFRHSRAMSLYRGGMPLPLLSEWLGHSNMQTTLLYAEADTKMKQEAIDRATSELNPLKSKIGFEINSNDENVLKRLYGLK